MLSSAWSRLWVQADRMSLGVHDINNCPNLCECSGASAGPARTADVFAARPGPAGRVQAAAAAGARAGGARPLGGRGWLRAPVHTARTRRGKAQWQRQGPGPTAGTLAAARALVVGVRSCGCRVSPQARTQPRRPVQRSSWWVQLHCCRDSLHVSPARQASDRR